MYVRRIGLVVLAVALTVMPQAQVEVHAQTLEDRIEAMRLKRAAEASRNQPVSAVPAAPSLEALLARRTSIHFAEDTFDEALNAWSRTTGIGLLINRPAWDNLGVDRSMPITVQLDEVPAAQALLILLDLGSDTFEFVAQPSPGSRPGLEILTKQEANRAAFVKVYDVRDLVMAVPNFTDAPSMNLGDALGGDASSGGGELFEEANDEAEPRTLQERGDALAETVRQSVEPGLWRANGGDVATARFRNGQLIVRAPGYVHAQIAGGALDGRPGHPARRVAGSAEDGAFSNAATAGPPSADEAGGTEGVSSVAPVASPDVAGVGH